MDVECMAHRRVHAETGDCPSRARHRARSSSDAISRQSSTWRVSASGIRGSGTPAWRCLAASGPGRDGPSRPDRVAAKRARLDRDSVTVSRGPTRTTGRCPLTPRTPWVHLQARATMPTDPPMNLDRPSVVGSDDADRAVLLEGGQLHLLDALEAVLSKAASASPRSMPWRANSALSHRPSRPIVVGLNSRIFERREP